LVAYRVSAEELALEFGTFFPGEGNRASADYEDFVLRVVMRPSLIPELIRMLQQAKTAHEQALSGSSENPEKA